jgi:hypothetical protein
MQRSKPGGQQKKPESVRKFRSRNFTYANEVEDDWLTCGFINYAHIKRELRKFKFHIN